ncbi:MAG: Clp protease N-terminal domain-containing protein, partial [Fermentimonas sp.]|nr:Clp protease N-terminal domain-containing protein [Fermentimonas sp.]
MNFSNFTIKAQETVQKAIEIAQGNNQQMIEATHILKGIMIVGENVTSFLFNKLSVNSQHIEKVVDAE